MLKIERVVTATKVPHEWKMCRCGWKCSVCGAKAAEFDDDGNPDPYGLIVYVSLDLVEVSCQELSVFRVMDD